MLMRSAHVARGLTRRSARGLALATQSHLDHDAVRAAENAIRAPRELRYGSAPPPRQRAGDDDVVAEMARRFDRARALSEAEREEVLAEADRIVQRRFTVRREMDTLVDAVETATAMGQSETEENARRWLETAGDDAAARASAFAEGGYLDPSDFTAAPDSPPTPPPIPRPPPGVTADVRDDVQDMNDYPGGLEAAMAQLFAGLPPTLQDSSSDSPEASSDSDASDSNGEPLFGAVTEPHVEADL